MKVRSVGWALSALVGFVLLVTSCEKSSLVAPSGSIITLTAQATSLPANGTTDIIAQVLEAAGTPPHSGTVINFTTTLGSIEPSEARTDTGGRVIVKFRAGPSSGTATINATSGGATTAGANGSTVKIAIGTAAVGRVQVGAAPNPVPAIGGTTTITANVADNNGNVLPSAPVFFTSTAGSLADSVVNTSADGSARTTLTTSVQATVTATVGVQGTGGATGGTGSTGGTSGTAAGTVVVNVSVAPTLVITPPTAPPSVGVPANFTFVVTAATANGSAVRNVHVDWGDGSSRDLGAITGTSIQSHVYQDDGTFTVTATVTDAIGNSQMVSASVTVIPVPRPSININFTPANPIAGNLINFTIQIVAAPGIGIVRTTIDFGDGDVRSLGGASSVTVQKAYASAGTRTVRVLVEDTTGQVTEGTTIVSVSP